jgi:RNA polymerase sigma-32 factor
VHRIDRAGEAVETRTVMNKPTLSWATSLLRAAAQQPMLAHDEEARLAREASAGNREAEGRLILSHLRFVIKIARGYRSSGLPMSDLVQQGTLGLIHAVRKFNPDRGIRLSTYAMWWIRASIQEHVVRSWSLVRVGTINAQKALFLRLRRMTADLFGGAEDLSDEIVHKLARGFGVTAAEVTALARRMAGGGDQSLDRPVTEGDRRGGWLAFLAAPQANPEEALAQAGERRFLGEIVDKALGMLPPRERLIIERRHMAEARATFDAIGREIGLSKDRVRQLERIALEKLRAMLQPVLKES